MGRWSLVQGYIFASSATVAGVTTTSGLRSGPLVQGMQGWSAMSLFSGTPLRMCTVGTTHLFTHSFDLQKFWQKFPKHSKDHIFLKIGYRLHHATMPLTTTFTLILGLQN